jgi:type II restriction enzyme
MAHKTELREQRTGTVINITAKQMEKTVMQALDAVALYIQNKFDVKLEHHREIFLRDVVLDLQNRYRNVDFTYMFEKSSMRPDGGILYLVSKDDTQKYPILISEVKNQGTNDIRKQEGKPKQAKGNAIERLGKNVIGLRTAMLHESIFPFVCFGDGCDFEDDSSILDRVITISMFGKLNKIRVHNEGESGIFNRGSFYFRAKHWEAWEMEQIMQDIAEKSVYYYFSKYGESNFR